MKNGLIFLVLVLMSVSLQAEQSCSSFFLVDDFSAVTSQSSREQRPKYFSVRNFRRIQGSELDTFLSRFKNIVQFSEKLEEVNSFIPEKSTTIPGEAFFIANKIVPLIEAYLKNKNISFDTKTIQNPEDPSIKRTIIEIDSSGSNTLNKLSKELQVGAIKLVVDPMELFFGYDSISRTQGRRIEIDNYNSAYALSFYLLLRSQAVDFKPEFSRDYELKEIFKEIDSQKADFLKQ